MFVTEISIPHYNVESFEALSGEKHYTAFGTPVAIEYWNTKPDFEKVSQPIIDFLRQHFLNKRIGYRMLSSVEHEGKGVNDLVRIIQKLGHDRYDTQRKDNKYSKIDLDQIELFMLEIEVGQELGDDGEEQIKHAFHSFYVCSEPPIKVDIAVVYNLSAFERRPFLYRNKEEVGHVFKTSIVPSQAILAILKIV